VIGHFSTLRGLETDKLEMVALLTVETEMKGDLKSSIEWDPSLVGSLGLSCRYKRFLFCHWCFTAQWKIFFPHRTPYLKSSVPLRPASWAGSRAGSPVSLSVSLIRDECLVSRDVFCHSFIRTLS
jgi:hypothetical protein